MQSGTGVLFTCFATENMRRATASFSRKNSKIMEIKHLGFGRRGSESKQDWSTPASVSSDRMTDLDVTFSPGDHSLTTHSSSETRFLKWVAYTRNWSRGVTEVDQRTCPMIDCEITFQSIVKMLKHVEICSQSRGVYRCLESRKEEKIGKCDTPGCHELKRGFVASVKRHFSGRRSKSPQLTESDCENPVTPQHYFETNSVWETQPKVAELSYDEPVPSPGKAFQPHPVPHGLKQLNSGFIIAELNVEDNSRNKSNNHFSAQGFASQSGTVNDPTLFPQYRCQKRFSPADFDIDFGPSSVPPSITQRRQGSVGPEASNGSVYCSDNTVHAQAGPSQLRVTGAPTCLHRGGHQQSSGNLSSFSPCADERIDELQVDLSDPYEAFRQTTQTPWTPDHADKIVVDASGHQMSQIEWTSMYTNMDHPTRMGSGSSYDTSVVDPVFSPAAAGSSFNSSIPSLDSSHASLDGGHETPNAFFEGSNRMFEEPEDMESFSFPSKDDRFGSYNSGARYIDSNGASIYDYPQPPRYILNIQHQDESAPFSPEAVTVPPTNNDNPSPPPLTVSSRPVKIARVRRRACKFCDFVPLNNSISNLSRHEKICKSNPNHDDVKRFKCGYRGCELDFSRSDNLRVHRRNVNHHLQTNDDLMVHRRADNHLQTVQFEVQFSVTPMRRV